MFLYSRPHPRKKLNSKSKKYVMTGFINNGNRLWDESERNSQISKNEITS